jgi:hypothetical protein
LVKVYLTPIGLKGEHAILSVQVVTDVHLDPIVGLGEHGDESAELPQVMMARDEEGRAHRARHRSLKRRR